MHLCGFNNMIKLLMEELHFVQEHPNHTFSGEDVTDYSEQDKYYVECLKAIENIMDIDAYIIDYMNKRVLYATKGCSAYLGREVNEHHFPDIQYLDKIIAEEEIFRISAVNSKAYDFFYSLPKERRLKCSFTQNYKIRASNGKTVLINHRGSILSLTGKGALRLTLCVISIPTNDKTGSAYIKMLDTGAVYEYISLSQRFIEVKTQKLSSKANMIIELASKGKTEAEIASELEISINTVKYHKKQIFSQIGVKNIAEAIQWTNNQKKMIKR